jgi:hypothetical protein
MINYVQILSLNYSSSQWSMSGNSYDGLSWLSETQKPTQEELEALWPATEEYYSKQACKQKASELLYQTDWTTIADISLPENNPYLMNQQDFISYRNIIRGYAVNPVVDPVWPTLPTEQWSS